MFAKNVPIGILQMVTSSGLKKTWTVQFFFKQWHTSVLQGHGIAVQSSVRMYIELDTQRYLTQYVLLTLVSWIYLPHLVYIFRLTFTKHRFLQSCRLQRLSVYQSVLCLRSNLQVLEDE